MRRKIHSLQSSVIKSHWNLLIIGRCIKFQLPASTAAQTEDYEDKIAVEALIKKFIVKTSSKEDEKKPPLT
jgi:hypothetical protein